MSDPDYSQKDIANSSRVSSRNENKSSKRQDSSRNENKVSKRQDENEGSKRQNEVVLNQKSNSDNSSLFGIKLSKINSTLGKSFFWTNKEDKINTIAAKNIRSRIHGSEVDLKENDPQAKTYDANKNDNSPSIYRSKKRTSARDQMKRISSSLDYGQYSKNHPGYLKDKNGMYLHAPENLSSSTSSLNSESKSETCSFPEPSVYVDPRTANIDPRTANIDPRTSIDLQHRKDVSKNTRKPSKSRPVTPNTRPLSPTIHTVQDKQQKSNDRKRDAECSSSQEYNIIYDGSYTRVKSPTEGNTKYSNSRNSPVDREMKRPTAHDRGGYNVSEYNPNPKYKQKKICADSIVQPQIRSSDNLDCSKSKKESHAKVPVHLTSAEQSSSKPKKYRAENEHPVARCRQNSQYSQPSHIMCRNPSYEDEKYCQVSAPGDVHPARDKWPGEMVATAPHSSAQLCSRNDSNDSPIPTRVAASRKKERHTNMQRSNVADFRTPDNFPYMDSSRQTCLTIAEETNVTSVIAYNPTHSNALYDQSGINFDIDEHKKNYDKNSLHVTNSAARISSDECKYPLTEDPNAVSIYVPPTTDINLALKSADSGATQFVSEERHGISKVYLTKMKYETAVIEQNWLPRTDEFINDEFHCFKSNDGNIPRSIDDGKLQFPFRKNIAVLAPPSPFRRSLSDPNIEFNIHQSSEYVGNVTKCSINKNANNSFLYNDKYCVTKSFDGEVNEGEIYDDIRSTIPEHQQQNLAKRKNGRQLQPYIAEVGVPKYYHKVSYATSQHPQLMHMENINEFGGKLYYKPIPSPQTYENTDIHDQMYDKNYRESPSRMLHDHKNVPNDQRHDFYDIDERKQNLYPVTGNEFYPGSVNENNRYPGSGNENNRYPGSGIDKNRATMSGNDNNRFPNEKNRCHRHQENTLRRNSRDVDCAEHLQKPRHKIDTQKDTRRRVISPVVLRKQQSLMSDNYHQSPEDNLPAEESVVTWVRPRRNGVSYEANTKLLKPTKVRGGTPTLAAKFTTAIFKASESNLNNNKVFQDSNKKNSPSVDRDMEDHLDGHKSAAGSRLDIVSGARLDIGSDSPIDSSFYSVASNVENSSPKVSFVLPGMGQNETTYFNKSPTITKVTHKENGQVVDRYKSPYDLIVMKSKGKTHVLWIHTFKVIQHSCRYVIVSCLF